MRALVTTSSLLLAGAAFHAVGCGSDVAECDLALSCPGYAAAPIDPTCAGEPMGKDAGPAPECGVFASPTTSSTGDGSKDSPFSSLQAAIDRAATLREPVFACGKVFVESVHVPAGVTVYGALDCDHGWVWTGSPRTTLQPAAGNVTPGGSEVALKLETGTGAVIEDVDVVAPDATVAGASSIAVLATGATARITRGAFTAGEGFAGAVGANGSATGLDGLAGNPGLGVCTTALGSPGGAAVTLACATGGQSVGGAGGDGGSPVDVPLPLSGADGSPASALDHAAGKGGAGEGLSSSCVSGANGATGADGSAGAGAGVKALGVLSASGLAGTAGGDGHDGSPGQGGGGGGGARGHATIACSGTTLDRYGASGGSGGTGGCGGQHGSGGSAGGSSLALVSVRATLTLVDVDLVAQSGGAGGPGGAGQPGGALGNLGLGGAGTGTASSACIGGSGGKGGYGGPGGGGRGGHSIGIAFTGTAPAGGTVKSTGTPGAGGAGGTGNGVAGGSGAAGVATPVQSFD